MTQTSVYKTPFRSLKNELRAIWDSNQSLYHAVLLSPVVRGNELEKSIELLEPAEVGGVLAASVRLPSTNFAHHAHYFFGSQSAYTRLWGVLNGLEGWMSAIPRELVPEFDLPRVSHHGDRNAALWASLVYYLAWKADVAYLQAELECQEAANDTYYYRWPEFPQPTGADPRYLLIHQKAPSVNPVEWKLKFEQSGYQLPAVVDAYFETDFILNSLAAIDVLLSLDQESALDVTEQGTPAQLKPIRNSKGRSHEIAREVKKLRAMLTCHHSPSNVDRNGDPVSPLTGYEIAQKMSWTSNGVNKVPSKVTRRMQELFGPDPMAAYARAFARDVDRKGYVLLREDGTRDVVSSQDYKKEMDKIIDGIDAPE